MSSSCKYIICKFSVFAILLFFNSCIQSVEEKNIAIQPYRNVNKRDIKPIQAAVKEIYDKELLILTSKNLPKSAFVNIKSPRYRADSIIRHLKKSRPDSIDIILGFTDKDISTTKRDAVGRIKKPKSRYRDWGVFGLGYRPGPSCIVSSFRVGNTNKKTITERLQKICIHEIGHNLGLKHCPDKKCVMTDACESIKTVDNVELALCKKCKLKINL